MNANYSEALEQQLAMARRLSQWPGQGAVEKNARLLLGRSESYYISAEIGDMLYAAAQSLPEWRLSSADHPTPRGFAWFERPPFQLVNDLGNGQRQTGGLCALLWGGTAFIKTESDGLVQGVCIQLMGRVTGVSVPWFETTWRYGESFGEAVQRQRLPGTGTKHDVLTTTADEDACIEQAMRLIASLWLFTQQSVLTTNREPVDRHARKRLAKLGCPETTVRVIRLRRPERSSGFGSHAEHEWSCQWVVRGHWRQQPYPKAGEVRPKWILPYVKGPDDKPLKAPRASVFAVVR